MHVLHENAVDPEWVPTQITPPLLWLIQDHSNLESFTYDTLANNGWAAAI